MNDKVLLIFESTKNTNNLKNSLIDNDYDVYESAIDIKSIHDTINKISPDSLVFYYKKARPEILEIVKYIQSSTPTPIIIFADESDSELVSATITNGASAFIVDGIETHRIPHIIDAAKARFNKCQLLKKKLDSVESKLDARKDIERAKGILMESKKISEDEAYNLLRSMAMNNNMRIEELSKNLITTSALFK